MTPRQTEILNFVRTYYLDHGLPPAVRVIQAQLGISSTSVVNYNLKRLAELGLLRREGRGYVPPVVEELKKRVEELEAYIKATTGDWARPEEDVAWVNLIVEEIQAGK